MSKAKCDSCQTLPAKFIERFSALKFCGYDCQKQHYSLLGLKTYTYDAKTKGPVLLKDEPNIVGLLSTDGKIFEIKKEYLNEFKSLASILDDIDTDAPIPIPTSGIVLENIVAYLYRKKIYVSDMGPAIIQIEIFYMAHYLQYTQLLEQILRKGPLSEISELPFNIFEKFYKLFLKIYLEQILSTANITDRVIFELARNKNKNILRKIISGKNDVSSLNYETLKHLILLNDYDICLFFSNLIGDNITQNNQFYLTFAAKQNCPESVRAIIDVQGEIENIFNNDLHDVINSMIKFGNLKMITTLFPFSLGSTKLLHTAVKYNQSIVFDYLMQHIKDFGGVETIKRGISSAIIFDRTDMFFKILMYETNNNDYDRISLSNNDYENNITLCATYGRLKMLQELLVYNKYEEFESLFIIASSYGHVDIVNFLLKEYPNNEYNIDLAIKQAKDNGHLNVEEYFSSTAMESSGKRLKLKNNIFF